MLKTFMTVAIAATAMITSPVDSQTLQRNLEAQRGAMAKLDALKGRWLGLAERNTPDGNTYMFTQTMIVQPHASGLILTIEGKSIRHGGGLDAEKPRDGSFAVVTYDDKAGAFEFRSFGFGEVVPAKAELVSPTVFRWTAAAGPAMLRFTIDLSKPNVWNELGERSGDGGTTWQTTNRLIAHRVEAR